MITFLLELLRLLPFLIGGHRQLALENIALRPQLAVYKRTVPRPKLRTMIVYSGSGWSEPGPAGGGLWSSSRPTPSYDGSADASASTGPNSRVGLPEAVLASMLRSPPW